MFMIVTYPWPVPAANVEPAGLATAAAVTHRPDAMPESGTPRPARVEDLIRWTYRERLRLRWYRIRLAASGACRVLRRACGPRLKLP
jgi:hypothetical protein